MIASIHRFILCLLLVGCAEETGRKLLAEAQRDEPVSCSRSKPGVECGLDFDGNFGCRPGITTEHGKRMARVHYAMYQVFYSDESVRVKEESSVLEYLQECQF